MARLADVLSLHIGVPDVVSLRLVANGRGGIDLVSGQLALMTLMCGDLHPLEVGLATRAALQRVSEQLPWIRGVKPPPHGADAAYLWAWLDVQERRYGAEHHLEPLPAGWRSTVSLGDFKALQVASTGEVEEVGFAELLPQMQEELERLGYQKP